MRALLPLSGAVWLGAGFAAMAAGDPTGGVSPGITGDPVVESGNTTGTQGAGTVDDGVGAEGGMEDGLGDPNTPHYDAIAIESQSGEAGLTGVAGQGGGA